MPPCAGSLHHTQGVAMAVPERLPAHQPGGSHSPRLYLVLAAGPLGATCTTKKLKSIVSSVNGLLFFSIYLLRHLGQIFTITLKSGEPGCCTNIYIPADRCLIAGLGENHFPNPTGLVSKAPFFSSHEKKNEVFCDIHKCMIYIN